MLSPPFHMVDKTYPSLVRRPDIKVTNKMHCVAVFSFGSSEIRVHPHALERFLERQDDTVWEHSGDRLETPGEALLALKDILDMSHTMSISREKRRRRREKYGVPATYLRYGPWRFIIHERERERILRTCYPVSEEDD